VKTVKLMLVGYGLIGRHLMDSLREKQKGTEIDLRLVAVCEVDGSLVNETGIDLDKLIENDLRELAGFREEKALDLLDELDVDVMVECTPGDVETGEPGLSHIRKALSNGVDVVTSNKSPLAVSYRDLMDLASENGARLRFEATVGAAIPVLGLKENGLQANQVSNVYGVLNGTSNYVLSKMTSEGVSLELALSEAQELGYAETDPSYDIDGVDTAAKVVILANHFLDMDASFSDVDIEGIRKITPESLELAAEHGYAIKLIGDAANLKVAPRLIPQEHPLNVPENLNAVMLETDLAEDVTLIGHGAGGRQTSSALMADILKVSKA